jgi:hypothetical protein
LSGDATGPTAQQSKTCSTRRSNDAPWIPGGSQLPAFRTASYALSLGLTNGELFSHVIAFSPGFMAPLRPRGTPKIYISHGVEDEVLPIDPCSRQIEGKLRAAGYDLDYREFGGGHVVPDAIATAFFSALVGGNVAQEHGAKTKQEIQEH